MIRFPFPSGPVRLGSVEPKTATTGTPSKVARCIVPGVVRQKQLTLPKFLDQLLESRAADEIDAAIAQCRGNLSAHLLVLGRAEKNPPSANRGSRGGEAFRQPALRRSVFRARTESQF